MARKLDSTKNQVISGPGQVFSGPGWAWSMSPWNQESISPDQFLGPWDPFGGILRPMEAEGRLIGGLGAKPPGIWGPYGPIWGPWLLSPLGGLLVSNALSSFRSERSVCLSHLVENCQHHDSSRHAVNK